jgi:hypothetical protein
MPTTDSCYLLLASLLIFEVSVAVQIHILACWVIIEFLRPALFWDFMQCKMVVLCQTSIQNYHSMLRTIPKESHFHHGRCQKSHERISLFHRAFQFTIYNGPTNALVCNKTLIQMSHTKTFKITPTCFDHQIIIIRELFDPG